EPRKAYRQKLMLEELEARMLLTTDMWTALGGGDWSDGTKWSERRPPLSDEDASITLGGAIMIKSAAQARTLQTTSNASLLVSNGSLTLAGDSTIGGPFTLDSNGALSVQGGTVTLASTVNDSGGAISVAAGAALQLSGGTYAGTYAFNLASG